MFSRFETWVGPRYALAGRRSRFVSFISVLSILGIAGIAFVLCVVATLYPAWRAGRTAPAEALRYE